MRLLEFEGKRIFSSKGLKVPIGEIACTPEEAVSASVKVAEKAGGDRFAVKAQVPFGGRGKAGLIKLTGLEGVKQTAHAILGREEHGTRVDTVLIEEAVKAQAEFYVSVVVDDALGSPTLLFSRAGGVDVEEAAKRNLGVSRLDLDPCDPPPEYIIRTFLRKAGVSGSVLKSLASAAFSLTQAFYDFDLLLVEVNPFGVLSDGSVIAMDAKVEIDDSGLRRQRSKLERLGLLKAESKDDPLERRASEIGVTYVQADGNIGVIASGAGLSMCTMDLIVQCGFAPANFLETGGGITRDLMRKSVGLVAENPAVRGIAINLYGGVNPLVEAALGVVDGVNELQKAGKAVPVVVKALGNRQDEAWSVLREAGILTAQTVDSRALVESVCGLVAKAKGAVS